MATLRLKGSMQDDSIKPPVSHQATVLPSPKQKQQKPEYILNIAF